MWGKRELKENSTRSLSVEIGILPNLNCGVVFWWNPILMIGKYQFSRTQHAWLCNVSLEIEETSMYSWAWLVLLVRRWSLNGNIKWQCHYNLERFSVLELVGELLWSGKEKEETCRRSGSTVLQEGLTNTYYYCFDNSTEGINESESKVDHRLYSLTWLGCGGKNKLRVLQY